MISCGSFSRSRVVRHRKNFDLGRNRPQTHQHVRVRSGRLYVHEPSTPLLEKGRAQLRKRSVQVIQSTAASCYLDRSKSFGELERGDRSVAESRLRTALRAIKAVVV
jgi:hypothetical protein